MFHAGFIWCLSGLQWAKHFLQQYMPLYHIAECSCWRLGGKARVAWGSQITSMVYAPVNKRGPVSCRWKGRTNIHGCPLTSTHMPWTVSAHIHTHSCIQIKQKQIHPRIQFASSSFEITMTWHNCMITVLLSLFPLWTEWTSSDQPYKEVQHAFIIPCTLHAPFTPYHCAKLLWSSYGTSPWHIVNTAHGQQWALPLVPCVLRVWTNV